MPKRILPLPTDGELSILKVLWRRGPSTVRGVWEELCRVHDTGYTTVLKIMQIMTEKGLLARDEKQRSHVYAAVQPACTTRRRLLGDLLEKAFDGSAASLVVQALSSRKTSPEELAEIRRLLDEMERSQ
jgi:BlaI family transcriptional regulator, penicillinase repressor